MAIAGSRLTARVYGVPDDDPRSRGSSMALLALWTVLLAITLASIAAAVAIALLMQLAALSH